MPVKKRAVQLIGLAITAIAVYFLHKEISQYSFADIRRAVADIPYCRLLFALLFTVVNYAILTLNDGLALKYIGKKLHWAKIGFASFVSNAISFNLGMAPLSGVTGGPHGALWGRTGEILYEHGNVFYNFQGLRQYKEKYKPV